MPIPTNTLTLAWKLPDDDTPIDGTWLIWLETAHGLAIDDAGNGIGGKLHLPTTSGTVTVDLPDTTDADYSPQNAWYKASFTSSDRRVRVKSEPFVMDEDKTVEDIFTVGNLPVTPSDLSLSLGYRNDAEGFADDAADSAAAAAASLAAVPDAVDAAISPSVAAAATSATAAAASATTAAGSATTATTQAGNAAGSATAAATSATAAAGSATTAGTNASNAATSATNAASSASAASTSAAAASGSAASAATQATNAGTSATNAAASAALAAEWVADTEVYKIRDWRTNNAWPARGDEPGPRLWIGPASVGMPPERISADITKLLTGL